jgi:hypothetical protein
MRQRVVEKRDFLGVFSLGFDGQFGPIYLIGKWTDKKLAVQWHCASTTAFQGSFPRPSQVSIFMAGLGRPACCVTYGNPPGGGF